MRAYAAGWADPGARLLREWALRPGLGARVAIINALYAGGAPVQRMLPVLIAESLRRDRCAPAAHSLVVPHLRWTGVVSCALLSLSSCTGHHCCEHGEHSAHRHANPSRVLAVLMAHHARAGSPWR